MSRIALLVGIDDYSHNPLEGCVADAEALAGLLDRDDDGSPNFECRTLLSSHINVTRGELRDRARELFGKSDADIAVFFFAGHGFLDSDGRAILVTPDASKGDEGVPMSEIVGWANKSPAKERIIFLDCCHAGAIDQFFATNGGIALEQGVSIVAACRDTETASEMRGHGLFSSLICNALAGGAADVTGAVTIASVYAYVDEVLTGWDQRPLLKANVSKLTPLRRAVPAVARSKLRLLTRYFSDPTAEFQLDPSYEPNAKPECEQNEKIFGVLQEYRAARLLEPVGTPHMYYAAIESKSCRLTPLGRFYWQRVKSNKI